MSEQEFEVGGHTYRTKRISTFDQMHVASQWRDALIGLAFTKKNRAPEVKDEEYWATVQVVFMGGLSRTTGQSRDEISRLLLSAVTRKGKGKDSGVGWFAVSTAAGALAFEDVQLPQMVRLQYEVLDRNGLLDFFSAGPSVLGGPTEEESGRPSPEPTTS